MATPETHKTLVLECADGRTRAIVYDSVTHLIIRSLVTVEPVEHGWANENIGEAQAAVDIPIHGTDKHWNAHDDPLPPAA